MISFLLLFLIIVGTFYFLLWRNKPTVRKTTIRFSRRNHFAVIVGYVVFLLAVLIISEFVERQYQSFSPVSELTESDYTKLDNALSTGIISETYNSQLIDKRTHPVGNTLKIRNDYDGAYIYIQRKNEQDGIIEELIYKPMFFVNDLDFSDKVTIAKPIWQDDTLIIPQQPLTEVQYITFHEAILLNQMTKTSIQNSSFGSSAFRSTIVYLVVPEGVDIETSSENLIEYVRH
ncbi:hypothetical protein MKY34_00670 [Sporosarcina sp. FSL K6-1522]|uniref:hypothetical protein n=1 Tax=Sporosarcina sp. FSL K6-1522 TaxID=2921554 RepID=UPI00315AEE11